MFSYVHGKLISKYFYPIGTIHIKYNHNSKGLIKYWFNLQVGEITQCSHRGIKDYQ